MIAEASWDRKGLDMLLAHYPMATVIHFDRHIGPNLISGPWISITLETDDDKKQFGIWKETGAVYNVDRHGACADDPFLVPKGSSYDGPIEEMDSQEKHTL